MEGAVILNERTRKVVKALKPDCLKEMSLVCAVQEKITFRRSGKAKGRDCGCKMLSSLYCKRIKWLRNGKSFHICNCEEINSDPFHIFQE